MAAFPIAGSILEVPRNLVLLDTFLMNMSDLISKTCDIAPGVLIVTTDLRDFPRCLGQGRIFGVYDLSSNETFFA